MQGKGTLFSESQNLGLASIQKTPLAIKKWLTTKIVDTIFTSHSGDSFQNIN